MAGVLAALSAVFVAAGARSVGVEPSSSALATPAPCLPRPSGSLPPLLYVADVSPLSPDEQLMFAALEGLVNRHGPQIYLEGEAPDTTSAAWLALGVVPMPSQTVAPYSLLTTFRSFLGGLVVWDPQLAIDTENVATTIAGVDGLLPVSPALAAQLQQAPYDIPVVLDLRSEHFSGRAAAYQWALQHYGPPHSRVLAWLGGTSNGLRDLIVACQGFVFQADPELDATLVDQILGSYPPMTPVFGYPCLGDAVLSTTQKLDGTGVPACEPIGVGEISESGKYLIPADLSTNLSVHAAFAPSVQAPSWNQTPLVPDPTKTYVTFVISDGDNVGYNEEYLLQPQWQDPAHGQIPMGISVSPWLDVYAPNLYAHYVQTMTPDDVLVSGPSGGGYVYPGEDPDLASYLAQTRALMDLTGLETPWILDNGYAYSPSPAVIDAYVQALHPPGIFTDYFGWITSNPPAFSFDDGVPVAHAVWGSCVADTVGRVQLTATSTPTRPAFIFVALDTWQMGFSSAMTVMSQLGPGYQVVRPDQFFALLKGAKNAGLVPASPTIPSFSTSPYCVP